MLEARLDFANNRQLYSGWERSISRLVPQAEDLAIPCLAPAPGDIVPCETMSVSMSSGSLDSVVEAVERPWHVCYILPKKLSCRRFSLPFRKLLKVRSGWSLSGRRSQKPEKSNKASSLVPLVGIDSGRMAMGWCRRACFIRQGKIAHATSTHWSMSLGISRRFLEVGEWQHFTLVFHYVVFLSFVSC